VEGCGVQADAETEVQGSSSDFIERGREGKAAAEAEVAKDGHGSGGLDSNSKGRLFRGNRRGFEEEETAGVLLNLKSKK
jgi:hypothetical protein